MTGQVRCDAQALLTAEHVPGSQVTRTSVQAGDASDGIKLSPPRPIA